jgi:hypothetical protein
MIIKFGDRVFELEEFIFYEDIRYSRDFNCNCGYSDFTKEKFNMIVYCNTNYGYMGVFNCPKCYEYYRHHINSTGRYSEVEFKNDVGLILFLQLTR